MCVYIEYHIYTYVYIYVYMFLEDICGGTALLKLLLLFEGPVAQAKLHSRCTLSHLTSV